MFVCVRVCGVCVVCVLVCVFIYMACKACFAVCAAFLMLQFFPFCGLMEFFLASAVSLQYLNCSLFLVLHQAMFIRSNFLAALHRLLSSYSM